MRITDELRNWFEHAYNYGTGEKMFEKIPHPWFGWRIDLERMLDRIDKEHEAQVADAFDTRNSDENLEADGWVQLPKDAYGEYWHIGDRSRYGIVDCMELREDGWAIDTGDHLFDPETMCHVRPDTWETIIEDACRLGFTDLDNDGLKAKLVERCHALAGEDE